MRHKPIDKILTYEKPRAKAYGGAAESQSRNPIIDSQGYCAKAFPLQGVKYITKKKGG